MGDGGFVFLFSFHEKRKKEPKKEKHREYKRDRREETIPLVFF